MTMIRFKLVAACLMLVTGLGLGLPAILADRMPPYTVTGPKDLKSPEEGGPALKITSKRLENGLIEFAVRIDAEAVEHVGKGDLYEGRVTAGGHLDLSTGGKPLASIQLNAVKEKKETVFWFSVAESLAETSKVTLNTHLWEKDGRPTFGGGHTFVISLQGFLPDRLKVEKKLHDQK